MRNRPLIVIFMLLLSGMLFSQYFEHTPNVGGIDWTGQKIRATGYGAANPNTPPGAQRAGALQAAKLVALRNMLEMVKGMNLNSQTTIENAMVSSDVIQTRVRGFVRNFRIVDERYMETGDIEVDVEVPLAVFNEILYKMPGALTPGSGYGANPDGNATYSGAAITGLIIVAGGLDAKPALAPRILDEQGNLVYGSGDVSREYAISVGIAGYEKDLERARANERVAGNPLVIKALKVSGDNKSDLVISDADASRIREAARHMKFLEQCKVMIILD